MPDKLTIYSRDRQWKADLRAFKDWAFVYSQIGTKVTVYHFETTHNVWGQSTTDWVEKAAAIAISNTYKGNIGAGGMAGFTVNVQCNSHYCEQKEWAWGFLKIDINLDTGQVGSGPNSAVLDISGVEGDISVGVGSEILHGKVSADNILSDSSAWG